MPAPRSVHRRVRYAFCGAAVTCLGLAVLCIWVGISNNHFYDAINRMVVLPAASDEERTLKTFEFVSDWTYFDAARLDSKPARWLARLEHASPLHVSARTALTAGADRIGPCGSLARSMIVLLHRAHVPARKAILYSSTGTPTHTVVEVRLDGEWRVFDPTYDWYWRRGDGRIATAEDLAASSELFSTVKLTHPDYPLDLYSYMDVHHLRWEKLPMLGWVRRQLTRVVGSEIVRGIRSPYLYERPAFLAALGAAFGAVMLVVLAARL